MRFTTIYRIALTICLFCPAALGQKMTLVKDINTKPSVRCNGQMAMLNGQLFFGSYTDKLGTELWKTDGTDEGTVLVKDLLPGGEGANPSNFVEVNGILFFLTSDDNGSQGLWKSDGTPDGTVKLKDVAPNYLVNVNGTLFFSATSVDGGRELWKSDGTPEGTMMVKDINPDRDSYPQDLINVNGVLYFTADDGSHGRELWKSDGTASGTVLVKDIHTGTLYGYSWNFVNLNGLLLFVADDGLHGRELWKTDGTPEGTVLVKDIMPGNGTSTPTLSAGAILNGSLYFTAADNIHGGELWKTDGTVEGTVLVADIVPGNYAANPGELAVVNNTLYFALRNQQNSTGTGLWKSNGTAEGTVLVSDRLLYTTKLRNIDGVLYFIGYNDMARPALWRSDGTPSGTIEIKRFAEDSNNIGINILGSYKGRIYLTVDDELAINGSLRSNGYFRSSVWNSNGAKLWLSDGTEQGTTPLRQQTAGTDGAFPQNLINVNGTLYFSAYDSIHGRELWKSNGTPSGTVMVKDIWPGSGSSTSKNSTSINFDIQGNRYYSVCAVGNTLFFSAEDGKTGMELWKSDGTPDGTVLVKDINPGSAGSSLMNMVNANGTLFFVANDGVHGWELWKSDGTANGTALVKDINPGNNAYLGISNIVNRNGFIYFYVRNELPSFKLWKSDGTPEGTMPVKESIPGVVDSYAWPLINYNGLPFFIVNDGTHGSELWKSDGTADGVVMVKDIYPGKESSSISGAVQYKGEFYFKANDGSRGQELWKSDGTTAGTLLVKDILPGPNSSWPSALNAINNLLVFSAGDSFGRKNLWRSDGTSTGTTIVTGLLMQPRLSLYDVDNFSYLVKAGNFVFFNIDDYTHGHELWISDGTAERTRLTEDIMPSSKTSNPDNLVDVNGRLFFTATDGSNGNELWMYEPDSLFISTESPNALCPNSSTRFTVNPFGFSPTTCTWTSQSAGIGGSGTSFTFTAPQVRTVTTYTISVACTDGRTTRTASAMAVVNPLPSFSALATTTTGCVGSSVRLETLVGKDNFSPTFSWAGPTSVSHFQPATGSVISVTPVQTGPHTMSLTLTDRGCSRTDTVSFTAYSSPTDLKTLISGELSFLKTSVVISVTARDAANYSVNGPAGSSANSTGNFVVTQSGAYTLTAFARQSNCSSSAIVQVRKQQPPLIKLLGAETKKTGVATLKANVRGIAYVVTGPGGYVFSNVYRVAGDYTVYVDNITKPGQYTMTVHGEDGRRVKETINIASPAKQLLWKSSTQKQNR